MCLFPPSFPPDLLTCFSDHFIVNGTVVAGNEDPAVSLICYYLLHRTGRRDLKMTQENSLRIAFKKKNSAHSLPQLQKGI